MPREIIQRTFEIPDALHSLCPDADWKSSDSTWESLEWLSDNIPKPTLDEVLAEVDRLQEEWDTTEYRRWRDINYPSVGDQLDDLYRAGMFSAEMSAIIKAVKDKFPKE
jgi:hypothetical protein